MNIRDKMMIRLELEALNVEFAYLIDHELSEQVAGLFTENGIYGRATGGRSVGRDAIRRAYSARAERGVRTARHIFTNLRLSYESENRVQGSCILLLFAEDGAPPHPAEPNLVADYDDIYERDDDGVWRYASRTVSHLFLHRDHKPVVLPLGNSLGT
jgi:hypothetical protein